MANPKKAVVIGVKVASGTAGEYVRVSNLSTGKIFHVKLSSGKEAVLNPGPDFEWSDGDEIVVDMMGRVKGTSGKRSIKSGGDQIVLSVSADSTTPGVSL